MDVQELHQISFFLTKKEWGDSFCLRWLVASERLWYITFISSTSQIVRPYISRPTIFDVTGTALKQKAPPNQRAAQICYHARNNPAWVPHSPNPGGAPLSQGFFVVSIT